jgi:hypothetical protein
MPDTHLILHVKGTEADFAEVPKEEVRTALAEGRMSQSQLIWIATENTWKPVKELPELLPVPVERLILHVKGTESETAELPKESVRAAISQGKMNLSQLIWSPKESTWKQAKEIPELLPVPVERLILHVKGTEADIAELPKEDVRAGISQGKITYSQLIWVPLENTWKQVREIPDLLPVERLILHVKGTEAETKELPKQAVRTALSQGQITHSQLIWSPGENTWKQVREMPGLLPTQKLAPVPARLVVDAILPESPVNPVARAADSASPHVRVATESGAVPKVRVATASASGSVPKVWAAPASGAPPRVKVASASAAAPVVPVQVSSTRSLEVKDEDGAHPLKWVCIGLGILIAVVLAGNYLVVDRPLVSDLSASSYSSVPVYAHLGAFMQPNVLVIHLPHSSAINPDNFADFLVALAHSTPESPLTHDVFDRIALTSGWTAQYSFSGYSWKQLGDMAHDDANARKDFLMSNLGDASGQSLLPESTLNAQAQEATRERVWKTFVSRFASGTP